MTAIGDIPFTVNGVSRIFRQLSVRECVNIQKLAGERRAKEAIDDAKLAGISGAELREVASAARDAANLSSELLRHAFKTEGALDIVTASVGSVDDAEAVALYLTPSELSSLAYQLLGYALVETISQDGGRDSKLVSRSVASRSAIG